MKHIFTISVFLILVLSLMVSRAQLGMERERASIVSDLMQSCIEELYPID